jgi:hypothetical protein
MRYRCSGLLHFGQVTGCNGNPVHHEELQELREGIHRCGRKTAHRHSFF